MASKTANPAVVIGLGGTGQWVLTYLKKNLLETYLEIPPTVKLLAFDTTSDKTEAKVIKQGKEEPAEEKAEVGNVSLDAGEYVYLGGNIQKICREIVHENKHPHIGSWLQAQWYLRAADTNAYDISGGAGQRRPFGRMAVFYDMSSNDRKIFRKINTAISEVKAANNKGQPVEIYIICSIAGGTGSGMFIDIAHLTRMIAQANQIKDLAVRGFLVMQNTFNSVINVQSILPNSFGAMRELDRFMQVFERDYPIYYSDDAVQPLNVYHSVYRDKLFDNCYLIDATRRNRPLDNTPPKLGIYPCVAECITAMLDAETGDAFSQHYKNVNNDIAKKQQEITGPKGKALFSSLGAYTYILPVEDIIKRNTLKAAQELLEKRLMRVMRSANGIVSADSTGNRESQVSPKDHARDFMLRQKAANEAQTLLFTQQVGRIVDQGMMKNPKFIGEIAGMNTEILAWLQPSDKDQVMDEVSNSIQSALNVSLIADVPNSRVERDDFVSAADRIAKKIGDIRDKQLGREEQGGRRTTGEIQRGLTQYHERNITRFRSLLADEVITLLNGSVTDAVVARTGKLPYVSDWLRWMIQSLDEFMAFMKEVIRERQRAADVAVAREDAIRTRTVMYDTRNLTGVIDKIKGTAVRAQDDYIGAETYLLDQERQELLYQAAVALAQAIQAECQNAKASIDRWMQVLSLGGPVDSSEDGALGLILKQGAILQKQRDEQKNVSVYQYLTDDKYEDDLYNETVEQQWKEILQRFKWSLQIKDNNYVVGLNFGDKAFLSERTKFASASEHNRDVLMDNLQNYFTDIRNQRVIDRMAEYMRADGMAKTILDSSSPLIGYEGNDQPNAEAHNFVCLDKGNQVRYVSDLEVGLKNNAPSAKENQVIGLSNRHRCIVLSTLDAITLQDTTPYLNARMAYKNEIGDRRLIHCFPAEVNASELEKRLTKPPLNQAERFLSPILVALLEDKNMLKRFIMARIFGLVREEAVRNQNQIMLRMNPVEKGGKPIELALSQPSSAPDWIEAMTNFVYPEVDKNETDKRYIWDEAHRRIKDGADQTAMEKVEPAQVDSEIELRQDAFSSGREEFVGVLHQKLAESQLLDPGKVDAWRGLFRQFLAENDRFIRRGDDVRSKIDGLCREYRGLLQNRNDSDLMAQKMMEVVSAYKEKSPSIVSSNDSLIRKYEDYIADQITPIRQNRDASPIMRDLASLMEAIIYDEIKRLERL